MTVAVAQRGPSILIRLTGDGEGDAVIVDPSRETYGPVMGEPSIKATGYWRDVEDEALAASAEALCRAHPEWLVPPTYEDLRQDMAAMRAAGFDETKIRRWPKGTKESGKIGGGKFAPKEATGGQGPAKNGKSEAAAPEHAPEKGEIARKLLGGAPDTQALYTKAGKYVPERLALHDEIIGHFLAAANGQKADHPVTLFMAGGSGAGKSTILAKLKDVPENAVLINPDEIKAMLPEYRQMLAGGDAYAAWGTHEESSDIAKKLLATVNERGYNTIVDGTGDSEPGKFLGKIEAANMGGRHAKVVLVDIPTDLAVERAMKRAETTGRMVPEGEIRRVHKSVASNFSTWQDKVDDWELWSNDDKPKRIAYRKGDVTTILDRKRYRQALAKANG